MQDKIDDIIRAGVLELDWIFIEFEFKMLEIEYKMINMNPYLSFLEKSQQIEAAYLKTKALI